MKNKKSGLSGVLKAILRGALFVLSVPARIIALPVRLYRRFISPAKSSPSCRFSPTCSEYCLISLREWGLVIGSALTLWRILRCNPWSRGGEDSVPENPVRRRLMTFLDEGQKTIPEERK